MAASSARALNAGSPPRERYDRHRGTFRARIQVTARTHHRLARAPRRRRRPHRLRAVHRPWRRSGCLHRLHLDVGGSIPIGGTTVTIGGILGGRPDRLADRLAYGPKLLMSRETLTRTGLVQPGSLIRWTYRVKLPEARAADKEALAAAR